MFNKLRSKTPTTLERTDKMAGLKEHEARTGFSAEAFTDDQRQHLDDMTHKIGAMTKNILPEGLADKVYTLTDGATIKASKWNNPYGGNRSFVYEQGNKAMEVSYGYDNDNGIKTEITVTSIDDSGEATTEYYFSNAEAHVGGFHGVETSDTSLDDALQSNDELLAQLGPELSDAVAHSK